MVDYFMPFLHEENSTLAQTTAAPAVPWTLTEVFADSDAEAALGSEIMSEINAICSSDVECRIKEVDKRTRIHVEDEDKGTKITIDAPNKKDSRISYDDSRLLVDNGGPEPTK